MLTKDQVKHVAKLANLPISEVEIAKFEEQLSETLNFVEQLDQVNTDGIEATHSVTGLFNVVRDDETEPSFSQQDALKNAKSTEEGQFKVKAIFKN